MKSLSCLLSLALLSTPALAGSLSDYTYFTTRILSSTPEASGLTYDRDTNTLFIVGDEGQSVDQYTMDGQFINLMTLQYNVSPREARAVDDPEGISYLGGNRFMIADERDNMGRITTYEAGGLRTLTDLTPTSYAFGPEAGNNGLEGVSFDPTDGSFWGIKENGPVSIYKMLGEGGTVTEPVSTRNITRLGVPQLSDIYVMANSAFFALDDPRRMDVLLLSRDANKILEVTRDGTLVNTLDISFLGRSTVEGLTMDDAGNILLTSEGTDISPDPSLHGSGLHILSTAPIPEPSGTALLGLGVLGVMAATHRSRQTTGTRPAA